MSRESCSLFVAHVMSPSQSVQLVGVPAESTSCALESESGSESDAGAGAGAALGRAREPSPVVGRVCAYAYANAYANANANEIIKFNYSCDIAPWSACGCGHPVGRASSSPDWPPACSRVGSARLRLASVDLVKTRTESKFNGMQIFSTRRSSQLCKCN